MTARSVLLAIASASFLRGDEPLQVEGGPLSLDNGSNGASLARRWRGFDQRAQLSLARANPQVTSFHKSPPRPPAVVFRVTVHIGLCFRQGNGKYCTYYNTQFSELYTCLLHEPFTCTWYMLDCSIPARCLLLVKSPFVFRSGTCFEYFTHNFHPYVP